jgi:hypothetical protein
VPAIPAAAALPAAHPTPSLPAAAPGRPFRAALAAAHHPAPPGSARGIAPPGSAAAPLRSALEGVERAQRRLDAVLAAARAGKTFSAQELLGLQADAYRFVQTVDLAAKLVEHGAQAVKQAVNTPL